MKTLSECLLFLVLLGGCSRQAGAPLEISDLDVVAPLPGSRSSAAYMTLSNNAPDPIVVDGFESPQFAVIEIHETRMENGVARMRELHTLTIPPRSAVVLAEGGTHLMLMDPVATLETDQPISLHVRYDSAGTVIVGTMLRSRVRLEQSE